MAGDETKIQAEIRRRALERAQELEEERRQKLDEDSNLEALEEVAELPRGELERIAASVRQEAARARAGRKKLMYAAIVGLPVVGLIALNSLANRAARLDQKPAVAAVELQAEPEGPKPDPNDTRPLLSREEAQALLEPELLTCLKAANKHHLYVRIGQGHDAPSTGPLYPLAVVRDVATVDYLDVVDFTSTPMGKCVAEAARGVRAPAHGGAYMMLEIENPAAPDPLAGAPERLDQKAAIRALEAFDGEARECAKRYPEQAKPGQTISFAVTFRGVDGAVTRVEPFYVGKGPYETCLKEAYRKAKGPRFRDGLSKQVLHKLPWQ
ncbi:hypothetical protein ACFL6X_01930 [Candidatus Latescibacterota bacterium]